MIIGILLPLALGSTSLISYRSDLAGVQLPDVNLDSFCHECFPQLFHTNDGQAAINSHFHQDQGQSWDSFLPVEMIQQPADNWLAHRMVRVVLEAADALLAGPNLEIDQLRLLLACGFGDRIAKVWAKFDACVREVLVRDAIEHGYDYFVHFPLTTQESLFYSFYLEHPNKPELLSLLRPKYTRLYQRLTGDVSEPIYANVMVDRDGMSF